MSRILERLDRTKTGRIVIKADDALERFIVRNITASISFPLILFTTLSPFHLTFFFFFFSRANPPSPFISQLNVYLMFNLGKGIDRTKLIPLLYSRLSSLNVEKEGEKNEDLSGSLGVLTLNFMCLYAEQRINIGIVINSKTLDNECWPKKTVLDIISHFFDYLLFIVPCK